MRFPKPQSKTKIHGIRAKLLTPGRGLPLQDAAVAIDGFQIAWVGEAQNMPVEYEALSSTSVPSCYPVSRSMRAFHIIWY